MYMGMHILFTYTVYTNTVNVPACGCVYPVRDVFVCSVHLQCMSMCMSDIYDCIFRPML